MVNQKPKIIVILGPTAAGKTGLAVQLARDFNGEIVSADSRQVYRGLDLGTSKDLGEYEASGEKIPYHLIDVVDPREVFDLAQYQTLAKQAIQEILSRHKLPIIVGGSGLYLQAIVDNYQLNQIEPDVRLRKKLEQKDLSELQQELKILDLDFFANLNESEQQNKRRLIRYLEVAQAKRKRKVEDTKSGQGAPQYEVLLLGLTWPIATLRERIKAKLLLGLEQGMAEEVRQLHEQGLSWERLDRFGLEYRYLAKYLQKEYAYDDLVEKLSLAIGQFAKRQLSWFKRWEKLGAQIKWISNTGNKGEGYKKIAQLTRSFLK